MTEDVKRVGVAVTLRLVISTDLVQGEQAAESVRGIAESAIGKITCAVDNEYVEGDYRYKVESYETETFRQNAE